jgi:hypothetical protein
LRTLLACNRGLVYMFARRMHKAHVSGRTGVSVTLDDLAHEGNRGLVHAARKFQPSKGFKLSTYATNWINLYMRRCIVKEGQLIRCVDGWMGGWMDGWMDGWMERDCGHTPCITERCITQRCLRFQY